MHCDCSILTVSVFAHDVPATDWRGVAGCFFSCFHFSYAEYCRWLCYTIRITPSRTRRFEMKRFRIVKKIDPFSISRRIQFLFHGSRNRVRDTRDTAFRIYCSISSMLNTAQFQIAITHLMESNYNEVKEQKQKRSHKIRVRRRAVLECSYISILFRQK